LNFPPSFFSSFFNAPFWTPNVYQFLRTLILWTSLLYHLPILMQFRIYIPHSQNLYDYPHKIDFKWRGEDEEQPRKTHFVFGQTSLNREINELEINLRTCNLNETKKRNGGKLTEKVTFFFAPSFFFCLSIISNNSHSFSFINFAWFKKFDVTKVFQNILFVLLWWKDFEFVLRR